MCSLAFFGCLVAAAATPARSKFGRRRASLYCFCQRATRQSVWDELTWYERMRVAMYEAVDDDDPASDDLVLDETWTDERKA